MVSSGIRTIAWWRSRLSRIKRLLNAGLGRDLFVREQLSVRRERLGSTYGGWWIHPDPLNPESVIYSIGVGDDITFDRAMIERFGVSVDAFDPTPRSVAWVKGQNLPAQFRFHSIGVAHFDGEEAFHPPAREDHMSYSSRAVGARSENESRSVRASVRRLSSIMAQLGHDRIDLLKMDIEGAEYAVIQDLVASGIPLVQLLVEFHHGHHGYTAQQTRDAIRRLNSAGFRIFSISGSGREYSFLRRPPARAAEGQAGD